MPAPKKTRKTPIAAKGGKSGKGRRKPNHGKPAGRDLKTRATEALAEGGLSFSTAVALEATEELAGSKAATIAGGVVAGVGLIAEVASDHPGARVAGTMGRAAAANRLAKPAARFLIDLAKGNKGKATEPSRSALPDDEFDAVPSGGWREPDYAPVHVRPN